MKAKSLLVDGHIPAGVGCPFLKICERRVRHCPTVSRPKPTPYSCAAARAFDTLAPAFWDLATEHFRGVVQAHPAGERFAYVILGVLVTDKPIESIQGNRAVLMGPVQGLSDALWNCEQGSDDVATDLVNAPGDLLHKARPLIDHTLALVAGTDPSSGEP